MKADCLLHAKWIIPVEPEAKVLENHTLVIKGDRIEALLPSDKAKQQYQTDNVHELDRHVLIPGLINAHTHAAMNLFRGLANDLPLMDWLNNYIWPAEQKWVSPGFVRDGTQLAVAEMLRGGTTCFNDMYFFPDVTAEVCASIGMRVTVGLILIDFPTAWADNAEEYLLKGEQVHDDFRHSPLVTTAFAPHAPYTVSDEPLKRINVLAEELDIPIHMHIHETAFEVQDAVEKNGQRPLARLAGLGVLSSRVIAVHMTQLEAEEIEMLVRLGVNVTHCPESNMKLASGFCPVDELIKAGVNVSIGTDGVASNNDLDMFGEMKTAALLGKAVSGDSTAMNAHTALKMATLNGAQALGLGDKTGSLKKGKQADVVAVNLDHLETLPCYDPAAQLVYAANRQQVTDVWVAGKQLLRDGQLTTVEYPGLIEKAKSWQKKITG